MRVRRSHDGGVGLAGKGHIVRIAAEALDEARVLQAAHGLADSELFDGHGVSHGVEV